MTIWSIVGYLLKLVGPILTVFYPAAASFEALESPQENDDKQWLTYWVIYSFVTLVETVAAPVLVWISAVYAPAKLLLFCWLVLPQFRGANYLYLNFIRPNGLEARKKLYDQFGDQTYLFKSQPVPLKKTE